MNIYQHAKLASHYKRRYQQMASYSRLVRAQLTRQEALDYAEMFRKYLMHRRLSIPSPYDTVVNWWRL